MRCDFRLIFFIVLFFPTLGWTVDHYWVGGTGNWSDTNHWSATSGGAGGAGVPTAADNCTFNSLSNAVTYTVTVDAPASCLTLSMNKPSGGGQKVTWAGGQNLTLSGSLDLVGGTAGINMGFN